MTFHFLLIVLLSFSLCCCVVLAALLQMVKLTLTPANDTTSVGTSSSCSLSLGVLRLIAVLSVVFFLSPAPPPARPHLLFLFSLPFFLRASFSFFFLSFFPGDVLTVFMSLMMGSMGLGMAIPMVPTLLQCQAGAAALYEVSDRKPEIDAADNKGKTLANLKGDIVLKVCSSPPLPPILLSFRCRFLVFRESLAGPLFLPPSSGPSFFSSYPHSSSFFLLPFPSV